MRTLNASCSQSRGLSGSEQYTRSRPTIHVSTKRTTRDWRTDNPNDGSCACSWRCATATAAATTLCTTTSPDAGSMQCSVHWPPNARDAGAPREAYTKLLVGWPCGRHDRVVIKLQCNGDAW